MRNYSSILFMFLVVASYAFAARTLDDQPAYLTGIDTLVDPGIYVYLFYEPSWIYPGKIEEVVETLKPKLRGYGVGCLGRDADDRVTVEACEFVLVGPLRGVEDAKNAQKMTLNALPEDHSIGNYSNIIVVGETRSVFYLDIEKDKASSVAPTVEEARLHILAWEVFSIGRYGGAVMPVEIKVENIAADSETPGVFMIEAVVDGRQTIYPTAKIDGEWVHVDYEF